MLKEVLKFLSTPLSLKLLTGIILLLTNQIVGWGGIAWGAYKARTTSNHWYYVYGKLIYLFSFGMLFLGIYLAGTEGLTFITSLTDNQYLRIIFATGAILVIVIGGMWLFRWWRIRKFEKGDHA